MTEFTSVNIRELDPPKMFPDPSDEAIFAELKARMIELNPEYEAALNLESEEITIAFQQFAYRLSVHQQDCNEGVLQQLLSYAQGQNLDWQGEIKGVGERHVIAPGDVQAIPPIDPVYESDPDYRRRIQLAPEGYSVAGPVGAYIYHALRADALVKDASAFENLEARVIVPILSHDADGVASAELIETVSAALNAEFTRPMNDDLQVITASIVPYQVDATLYFYSGPDRSLALDQARARLAEFVSQRHRLGDDVPLSGIYAALHIPNVVSKVELRAPLEDLPINRTQAAYCDPDNDIALIDGGSDV